MSTPALVIVGAGGHAREIVDLVDALKGSEHEYRLLGLLDSDPTTHGTRLAGVNILGGDEWFEDAPPSVRYVIGIGSPKARSRISANLDRRGFKAATLVHPSATRGRNVSVGAGTVITAGVRLTNTIVIGQHVVLNLNVTVSHDCIIKNFVTLSPGTHLPGNVTIEEGCDIGTNATVIPGTQIGAWSIIGAGACVTKDVPPRTLAVGVPAKVVRQL